MAPRGPRRALITGGSGFAGSHLADLLASEGWKVAVFDTRKGETLCADAYIQGDIRSAGQVLSAVEQVRPEVVFHLAGIAFVPAAEEDRETALAVNLHGGLHLLEGLRKTVPEARVLIVSSSEVYGKVPPDQMPLHEDRPVRPANFYAFTKAALENAAFCAASNGMKVTVLRPFNHIGPGQSPLFVAAAFARQIAGAESGRTPRIIKVGNLEAVRDFTDVREMVSAYRVAAERDLARPVYNLSSGRGVAIQDILDALLDRAKVKISVEVDPARLRPSDMPVLIGDSSSFQEETGWRPRIPIRESLIGILDYWRAREVD